MNILSITPSIYFFDSLLNPCELRVNNMVSSRVLPEEQREQIQHYLEYRPIKMPDVVRQIRSKVNREMDLDQMESDIQLLRRLASLDLKIGRPTEEERDMKAIGLIRHKKGDEVKAITFINYSKYDAIINRFLEQDDPYVQIEAPNIAPKRLEAMLYDRLFNRNLEEKIKVVYRDNKVYLERKKNE